MLSAYEEISRLPLILLLMNKLVKGNYQSLSCMNLIRLQFIYPIQLEMKEKNVRRQIKKTLTV